MKNNENKTKSDFNFDYWVNLASNDPVNFQVQKNAAIDSLINESPEHLRHRLRGLQWRIDIEVKRSKNSLDSCVRIQKMMMDIIYAPGGLVESLHQLTEPEASSTKKHLNPKSNVVAFTNKSET